MKKLFILLFLFVYCTISWAAYQPKNFLQKEVREGELAQLILPNDKWIKYPKYADRDGWKILTGENRTIFISNGEKYLNYQWKAVIATDYLCFSRNGNRSIMEDAYNSNLNALSTLFIAELAEGNGRFMDQIINGIYFISEMTTWSLSAHLSLQQGNKTFPDHHEQIIDLVAGDVGSMFSWIYYFLHTEFDKIHPLIAERIEDEIAKRILKPYIESDFWWMATNVDANKGFVNNWNPWCNANTLQCFLLMEKDPIRRTRGVYKTMVSVDQFINYINNDGACEEGTSYWGHAAGKMYDYLQILCDATDGKVNISNNPMIRQMGEYIDRSYVGNGWVVNFADASGRGNLNYELIYRYGKMVDSPEMMGFAAYLKKEYPQKLKPSRDLYRLLADMQSDEELSSIEPTPTTIPFMWYPQTEFCYIHSGNIFLAAKGGNNDESHNHNDIGAFSLYVDNNPIFIDAGVGTYTRKTFSNERYSIWTMQSDFHNLPQINGYSQKEGRQYKARSVKAEQQKNSFSLDIANAYPHEANIKKWIRNYRVGKSVVHISDKFELLNPQKLNELNFLTWGQVDISRKGLVKIQVNNTQTSLIYNANQLEALLETIDLDDPKLVNVWGSKIFRLKLKARKIEKQGEYKITIKNEL